MRKFFGVGSLVLLCGASYAQSVVYSNTTTFLNNDMPLLPEWRNDSAEAGDEVWLGGTARTVTGLKMIFNYRGTEPGTIDLRVRFRTLDEFTNLPGDAFFESDLIQGVQTLAGLNEYNIAIPDVVVPDHFVWTVQAYNRQGSVGELGPAYYNPPSVGFSDDFFWLSDMGSPWTQYTWGGDPYANFGAEITAVPEPASILLLAGGIAAVVRRRRRSA